MHYLVYVSSARQHFSEEDLETLLISSRQNNSKLGITGMLLFSGDNFIQVLEGELQAINSLYSKISSDPRHTGLLILLKGEVETRNFPQWSMGFKKISKEDYSMLSGYERLGDVSSQSINTPAGKSVLLLLKNFLKINPR